MFFLLKTICIFLVSFVDHYKIINSKINLLQDIEDLSVFAFTGPEHLVSSHLSSPSTHLPTCLCVYFQSVFNSISLSTYPCTYAVCLSFYRFIKKGLMPNKISPTTLFGFKMIIPCLLSSHTNLKSTCQFIHTILHTIIVNQLGDKDTITLAYAICMYFPLAKYGSRKKEFPSIWDSE